MTSVRNNDDIVQRIDLTNGGTRLAARTLGGDHIKGAVEARCLTVAHQFRAKLKGLPDPLGNELLTKRRRVFAFAIHLHGHIARFVYNQHVACCIMRADQRAISDDRPILVSAIIIAIDGQNSIIPCCHLRNRFHIAKRLVAAQGGLKAGYVCNLYVHHEIGDAIFADSIDCNLAEIILILIVVGLAYAGWLPLRSTGRSVKAKKQNCKNK